MPISQSVDLDNISATVVAGEGVAGTPTGGVLTVQGSATGTPVPVTGSQVITKVPLNPNAPMNFTAGTTTAVAITFNANRKGMVVTNLSINKISVGLGVAAVANMGIVLYPGGVWVMDDYTFTLDSVSLIASAASSLVSIQEFA